MKLNLNNLDKSNWQSFRFDEIAKNISKRVDPTNTDLELYIGLEHLDAESIHLKRSGTKDQIKSQKLKCYPGDVIFGKRRAYQRKAALVTEAGICSAHAFVLRAIPDVIDPRLFPFFLHSDQFMHRGIDISVGGLSPTINWKTLKEQEFMLPPKEQQAQITELLWAVNAVMEREHLLADRLNQSYDVENNNFFSATGDDTTLVPLKKVASINKSSLTSNTCADYEFQYLDIASIVEPKQLGKLSTLTYASAPSRARRIVSDNSIILSLVRPYQRSFVMVESAHDIIASTGIGVVDVNPDIDPRFIYHQFFCLRFLRFCENRMTGTNYPAITPQDLRQYKIILATSVDEMKKISRKLDSIDESIKSVNSKLATTKALQKSLINQVF